MIRKFTAGKLLAAVALVGVGMAFGAMQATAGVISYELDVEFTGATPPEGSTPWLTATFDDSFGGADTVRLTMEATNLTDAEFVGSWYFNFDPALDASQLSIVYYSSPTVVLNSLTLANDCCKAGGDGYYDILFDFAPPGDFAAKFTAGESAIVDLVYTSAIDVNSFDFIDNGGTKGDFHTAAHVQGIGANDDDSGWVGDDVPDPAALGLFGLGLIGLAVMRRRRKIA